MTDGRKKPREKKMAFSKINPVPWNPRDELQPGEKEYEGIKKSLEKFDQVDTLTVNERTGNLLGGHQRLNIMKEMGRTSARVTVVDIPEDEEPILNLALNKHTGRWNDEKLDNILEEINTGAFDIEITGFDEAEIEERFADAVQKEPPPPAAISPELFERHDYILFYFDNEFDWQAACDRFGVEQVVNPFNKGKAFEQRGLGRVVSGKALLEKLDGKE